MVGIDDIVSIKTVFQESHATFAVINLHELFLQVVAIAAEDLEKCESSICHFES